MSQGRLIVACDFGTTAFRALVTEISVDGSLEILGCSQEPTEGFQDGDFVNLAAGTRCIARTMRAVEADCDIFGSVELAEFNCGCNLQTVICREWFHQASINRSFPRDGIDGNRPEEEIKGAKQQHKQQHQHHHQQ